MPFKGPRLASCVASGTTEIQGHRQVWPASRGGSRTPSRTIDANLDWAFVEKALLFIVPKIGRSLASWPPFMTPLPIPLACNNGRGNLRSHPPKTTESRNGDSTVRGCTIGIRVGQYHGSGGIERLLNPGKRKMLKYSTEGESLSSSCLS